MTTSRSSRVVLLLVGLPLLSNIVSFIIFAPLYSPGHMPTSADFQRQGTIAGVAILFIELLAVPLLAIFLRAENTSIRSTVNLQRLRLRSYLVTGTIALIPTLAAGWLYTLAQTQAGVVSDWSVLTQGEVLLWYVLTPVLAAVLEETIWRGYAIPRVPGRTRSLLLTSLSFAVFHGIFNPLAIVATFVQGLAWGWTYQRTDSTVPGMALHFLGRYLAFAL